LVGHYGIRIENLIYVRAADVNSNAQYYEFGTLTLAPYDRTLIATPMLTAAEKAWVDAYHAMVLDRVGPLVSADVRAWLAAACAPL
jgi:Xaa-Pro aminopeptidase